MSLQDRIINHFSDSIKVQQDTMSYLTELIEHASQRLVTALLQYNFPTLAAKNTHDMKWKKFLYKQLCEAEGLFLCRAPSCQVCADYGQCYGSEEQTIDSRPQTNDNDSYLASLNNSV